MPDSITVIINATAGTGASCPGLQELTEKFRCAGLLVTVIQAKNGEELIETAQRAVANGADIVVAGGGDGTINAVASAVIGTRCTLGVLPMGTLNHFAKDLGIPTDIDAAIAVVAAGHRLRVDVGEVNGRTFLNNSSLGLYPNIVRDRQHQQRRFGRGKWLAFLSATATALRRYPFLDVRLDIDGRLQVLRTPFIFIGNNEYSMTGFTLGTRSDLTRGLLSLYVAQRTSRLGLLRLAIRSLFGRLHQAHDFTALLARQITVETHHRRLPVSTDGEVNWMNSPLHYTTRHAGLTVLAPAALQTTPATKAEADGQPTVGH